MSASSPQPFSQNACTSLTLPMTPVLKTASGIRCDGIEDTWMPICVSTRWPARVLGQLPYLADGRRERLLARRRAGPARIAAIAMGACM